MIMMECMYVVVEGGLVSTAGLDNYMLGGGI
jgi:hypothetical protein